MCPGLFWCFCPERCSEQAVRLTTVSAQAQSQRRLQVKGTCKGMWSNNLGEKGFHPPCEHPYALQALPVTWGPGALVVESQQHLQPGSLGLLTTSLLTQKAGISITCPRSDLPSQLQSRKH